MTAVRSRRIMLSGAVRVALRYMSACACICALAASQHAYSATQSRGFAVDSLDLPASSGAASAYAIDLNGDGHVDNAFGNVLSALGTIGLDVGGATAAGVAQGQIVHLVEVRSSDAGFTNDPAAEVNWYVGEPTLAPPVFDGTDTFQYDAWIVPGSFVAVLAGSGLVSADPATATDPVDITVDIQIGNEVIGLPLQGARIACTVVAAGLSQGQINGSIRKTDVDTIVIPALAVAINDLVQSDPQSDTAQNLLSLFDTNPTDGVISVEEVATSSLIGAIFTPDVQIRNGDGDYAPNPANTNPDALSLGFGFSAVESKTVLPPIFADGFDK